MDLQAGERRKDCVHSGRGKYSSRLRRLQHGMRISQIGFQVRHDSSEPDANLVTDLADIGATFIVFGCGSQMLQHEGRVAAEG